MVREHLKIRSLEGDQGFTLIEVMIAMFCFMIVALATFRLSATSWQATDFSRSKTEASILAAQHLETLFSEKYSGSQTSAMSGNVTDGTHSFSSDGYTISYTVSDNALLPDTKFVQMNVNYSRGATDKNVTYNYLLPMRK